MEVNGTHNIVGKMSVPTTLLGFCHARKVVGYCPTGVQGTVLGIAVDLSVLSYFLCHFSGPYRAGVPGRLVLAGSDCASRRRAVSKVFVYPSRRHGVGVRSSALARPSSRRGHPEAVGDQSERSGQRGGPESENGRCSSLVRPFGQ